MGKDSYLPELQRIKHKFNFDFVGIALVLEGKRPLLTWYRQQGIKTDIFAAWKA